MPAVRVTYRCRCSWLGRRRPDAPLAPCPWCGKSETLTLVTGPADGPKLTRVTVHLVEADLAALGPPESWRTQIRLAVASAAASRRSTP